MASIIAYINNKFIALCLTVKGVTFSIKNYFTQKRQLSFTIENKFPISITLRSKNDAA